MTAEEAINYLYMQNKTMMTKKCTDTIELSIKALETIDRLKSEIKETKKILSDPATVVNQDYRTGYICGLSFVEGLIG